MAPQLKFAALSALVLGAASVTLADTLFSTTGNGNGYVGFGTSTSNGHQGLGYGDEIVLPTAGYIFTGATFNYYASAGAAGGALTFRIYDLTGPAASGNPSSPGNVLFQSTGTIVAGNNNLASITYSGGDFVLPARFAYTVSFAGTSVANDAGLLVGGTTDSAFPGQSGADYWQSTGPGANDWALNQVGGVGNYGNFKVTITGNVPEPTTVALGVVGAAALVGAAFRRNRR